MNTRQRIFDEAIALIERNGSAAVSMRQLAGEVQLTPMALYRHFANRDALLTAIADHYFADMADRWQGHTKGHDYEQALILIGIDLVDFSIEHPHLYQLMFIEPRPGARDLYDIATSSASPTLGIVMECVRQGMATGALQGNSAQEISLALAGQLHGLIALRHGGRLHMSDAGFRSLCQNACTRVLTAYKM